MAEAILSRLGIGKFRAFSAGSHPTGRINPFAIEQIASRLNVPTDQFRSKDWGEFAAPGAPALDFVFTVCDNAANEVCPVWPGQPMTAHWGVPDPAAVEGLDEMKRLAFARTYNQLYNRIQVFTALPVASLDKIALKKELDAIGQQPD
jgi:protein-tyrosine-phosphatase